MKIGKFSLILAIATTMALTGVAAACPNNTNYPQYDNLLPHDSVSGTKVTYLLDTVNKAGASVIEYCVYPTSGLKGQKSDLTAFYSGSIGSWIVHHSDSKTYFGFDRGSGGDPNNLPIDGTKNIQVGSADYKDPSKMPTSEIILFHINDPAECQSENTCWRLPGKPPQPTPEASTIAMVSIGLIGTMLITRKTKR
jgi:hypothetical protein